jgi:acyl-coenzyme A synthetase/AMP-(fatty) acid ligase
MDFFHDIKVFASSTALIDGDSRQYTYRQLLDIADELCGHIGKRCVVFSVCRNSFESIAGYIGFLRSRIVPLLLSDGLNPALFKSLLQQYKPEYIWLPEEISGRVENGIEVFRLGNYILLKNSDYTDPVIHDELALLLTTSGSTGSFKLVRQSYKNIVSNANSVAQYLDISNIDRPITTLPMNYTFGLSVINSHLLKGCSIVLTGEPLVSKVFWNLLKRHEASTFSGVPYTYEILKRLRFSRMQLPSLKVLTQAGGKMNAEMSLEFAQICKEKNIGFFVMYGQTEATARMSYLPRELAISKVGSVGTAIPGGRFWLEDDSGNVIHENETAGELIYQGDNVAMGYAQGCGDLSNGYENGNILRTGDIARRDVDGHYYIVGRKKRFLKIFGNRINLDEVEQMLKGMGHDCACVGDDDCMKIYTTNSVCSDEIENFLSKQTGLHASGFKVICIDAIPRNESGKPLYSVLKQE